MREAGLSAFVAAEGATPAPRPGRGDILPLLAEGLVLSVGARRLVNIDRLVLGAGGVTAVMGPNGAGKSLLLRLLHGLIAPTAGSITWNGTPMGAAIRQRQAMVFQKPVLLRRSVAANVRYALKAHGVPRTERPALVAAALDLGALSGLARQPARTLSSGEQQRLALVRAMTVNPDILFLDEPTSSLDPASTLAIERLIAQAARRGTKIVLVTHDLGQARRLSDEVVFLHRGRVAEHCVAASFFDWPRSQAARDFIAGGLVL